MRQLSSEDTQGPQDLDIACQVGKEEQLAAALAPFLRTNTVDKSVLVVNALRDAYKEDPSTAESFDTLVRTLSSKLKDSDLSFAPDTSGPESQFGQVDPLLVKLTQRLGDDTSGFEGIEADIAALGNRFAELDGRIERLPGKGDFWALMVATLINFGIVMFLLLSKKVNSVPPPPPALNPVVPENSKHQIDQIRQQLESALIGWGAEIGGLKERCDKVEEEICRQVEARFEAWHNRLTEIENRIPQGSSSPPDLVPLRTEVGQLRNEVEELRGHSKPDTKPSASPLAVEYAILGEVWAKLPENSEILAASNGSLNRNWDEIRDPLLIDLPKIVPEEIKPTLDMIFAPARDFDNMVTKLRLVPRVLSKSFSLPKDVQGLKLLRELTSLLTMIQNSSAVADRLNFRLEQWVGDQFVSLADLFLQRFQQAQLEGRQNVQAKLDPGLQIVRRVLKIADLEPVDLTPGQTRFDSNRHMGRSTASNPSFADGIIVGVVRNGFIRGGREVIRQPEVIVNRLS